MFRAVIVVNLRINQINYIIMKNTKKPLFVVDLTKAETPEDVRFEFIRGKALAGQKLTDEDLKFLVRMGANAMLEVIDEHMAELKPISFQTTDKKKIEKVIKILMPKEPWYKRFWKWLKKPFTKK